MAIFRMIQTKFWNVSVMEVMFFLMYLLINRGLTQFAIYWITKKQEALKQVSPLKRRKLSAF
ncbi:hypothetical protein LQ50_20795 [Halalkalibacter okhensis]|uniref:Uncharacterized protein n=1 Tax=Halalkalibacter okhensis TaxID=333138 RepID=A0A0B0IB47_9BACI|nr:hypothetical protein LQ50_20795 [Halalkalibacter okhensis]